MPGNAIGNLGSFTPSHCTVCRAPIPKVEDPSPSVRKWARNLNYMNHLKKYHPRYYKWSKRWTNSLYVPLIPFLILVFVSAPGRSVPLLLTAVAVFVISYVPLLIYRWKKVRAFRETWTQTGEA